MLKIKIFYPNVSSLRAYDEKTILKAVSDATGIHQALILSKVRKRPLSEARHVLAVLLTELLGWTYKEVIQFLNWENHTSVIHAIRTVRSLPHLRDLKTQIARELNFR